VVADALDVPARYEVAVEAVLGDRLQTLLAGNVTDIRQSLEFLRVAEGRCSFLLPKAGPSAPEPIPVSGQRLAELIQVESTHAAAIRGLFAGVFLVQSLEPFYAEPPPAGTVMVTEAGEILSGTGEIAGGGRQGLDQGLLHRKREMKELAGHVERLSGEVVALQEIRLELREEIAATEELLREAEAALHRKELKIIDSEKDRQRLRQEEDRLLDKLEVLNLEDDQLHGEKEELHRQLAEVAQGQLEREQRKGDLEGTVARLQEEIQVLRRETGVVREWVVALKVAVASIREREEASRKNLERLGHLRKDLQNRLLSAKSREAEGEEEQARLLRQRERLQAELEVLFRRRDVEKSRLVRHRDVFEAVGGQVEAQEEALKVLRTRVSQAREELTTLQLRGRELVLEIDHLNQSVGERYRIDLAQEVAEEADFDPSGAENRLRDLRRLIDDIGEVNLTAIDEYRELEERYQFLSTQQEDLRQSLEGLQAAIGKINRTTRKRFSETFDRVNSQFREVFPRLFNGGKAELQLTDSEDLLETGIDIIVQPPGKKLQCVNLLSGGEKALTAVALIFSIFMINPSPFCMLDEVDAPLDDANIGRFNDMIREMSAISQFIIITHSKRSMEVADTLYGITMEEPGISKMVSVRMNDFAA
jgi:chromosome segregation protein